jgi:hypothetical protein
MAMRAFQTARPIAIAALAVLPTTPAYAAPAWAPDWETLKGIGSLGAVLISLAAFVVSWRTGQAKATRELREELRDSIGTLIELRSEFMKTAPTIADEEAREFFSATINTKKAIYLASAEHLARQLPYVTHAEWMVLATEYSYESNYKRAEVLLKHSVKAAETSSTTGRRADGAGRGRVGARPPVVSTIGRSAARPGGCLFAVHALAHVPELVGFGVRCRQHRAGARTPERRAACGVADAGLVSDEGR